MPPFEEGKRVFGGVSLLKVGVALMALALALVVAAVLASVVLRSEPEGVVAAEVATKSPDEPPRYSSEESPGYGSSSSYGGPLGQQEGEAKGQQGAASPSSGPEANPAPAPQARPDPAPGAESVSGSEAGSEGGVLPGAEGSDWAKPTPKEIEEANSPRHYGLAPGAIMALTIQKIGVYDAPVYDSDSYWALANGIAHNPETSLPWSNTPQRNVFLAGHRMGFRGTWSRMIFYNLDELVAGDKVVLRDREGRRYEYRVSEVFVAEPTDVWVMGQVRGRDMLTLQTCTPIPTFEHRLIVRADRI